MEFRRFSLGIGVALALAACGNPSSSPLDPGQGTPAAAPPFGGFYFEDTRSVACYWENGVRHSLGVSLSGSSRAAASTASSGGAVYVAGHFQSGSATQPCYWADGNLVVLKGADGTTDLANGGRALGIAVSGDTVYAVGFYFDGDMRLPCYWIGSARRDLELPDGHRDGQAISIAVSASGTVYIAGFCYSSDDTAVACCWTDGAPHVLAGVAGTSDAYAYSIALSGDSVYMSGYCRVEEVRRPCYWENGECKTLDGPNPDKSFPNTRNDASAIAVSDGKVYTAGNYRGNTGDLPCYWEGTTFHALTVGTDDNAYAAAITLSEGTVFVAGSYRVSGQETRTPCYWENGVLRDLSGETPDGSIPGPGIGES